MSISILNRLSRITLCSFLLAIVILSSGCSSNGKVRKNSFHYEPRAAYKHKTLAPINQEEREAAESSSLQKDLAELKDRVSR